MQYQATIGIEVHAQLLTKSKMFCDCPNAFGGEPNTRCCPICLGLPGVLPVANKQAIEFTMMTGLALNCTIAPEARFARKNYLYPDLPKGYQISQYESPISAKGYIDLQVDGATRRIGITRCHLEEDTGKLMHTPAGTSLLDFNRCGVPLMEIVTEPDMNSTAEARAYLTALRAILQYLGVSSANMEEGAMRCECNVSVAPAGADKFGVKVEVKNLNSFRSAVQSLEYEIERQTRALERGEPIAQETRRWDEANLVTAPMRSKESAHDYRYFPDPDLVPFAFDPDWVHEVRARLPELPAARRQRFVAEYGLPEYDAGVLTESKALADYYEECVRLRPDPKVVSNWVTSELSGLLNERGMSIEECPVRPAALGELLGLIQAGTISGKIAKSVLQKMFESGKGAAAIVEEQGLTQISDEAALAQTIERVLREHGDVVAKVKAGQTKAMAYLVGQVMKATGGRADPARVNEMLRRALEA